MKDGGVAAGAKGGEVGAVRGHEAVDERAHAAGVEGALGLGAPEVRARRGGVQDDEAVEEREGGLVGGEGGVDGVARAAARAEADAPPLEEDDVEGGAVEAARARRAVAAPAVRLLVVDGHLHRLARAQRGERAGEGGGVVGAGVAAAAEARVGVRVVERGVGEVEVVEGEGRAARRARAREALAERALAAALDALHADEQRAAPRRRVAEPRGDEVGEGGARARRRLLLAGHGGGRDGGGCVGRGKAAARGAVPLWGAKKSPLHLVPKSAPPLVMAWDTVVTAGGETVGDLVVREVRWRAERPHAPPLDRRGVTRLVLHAIAAGRLLTHDNEVFLDMVLKYRAASAPACARRSLHPRELLCALRANGVRVDGATLRRAGARIAAEAGCLSRRGRPAPCAAPRRRGGSSGGA